MKYFQRSDHSKISESAIALCLAKLKKLDLSLNESELIQMANLLPGSEVELYLVSLIL
jgi:hypothetical protein